jgi:hypothetical protein
VMAFRVLRHWRHAELLPSFAALLGPYLCNTSFPQLIYFSAFDGSFVSPSYHMYVWSVLVPFTFLFRTGLHQLLPSSLCVYPLWDSGGKRPTGRWSMLHQCRICSMANVMIHDNIRSWLPPLSRSFNRIRPPTLCQLYIPLMCGQPLMEWRVPHRVACTGDSLLWMQPPFGVVTWLC